MVLKEKGFYNAKDIQKILDCGKSKAYNVIKSFNNDRAQNNLFVVPGRIPVEEFNAVFYSEVMK